MPNFIQEIMKNLAMCDRCHFVSLRTNNWKKYRITSKCNVYAYIVKHNYLPTHYSLIYSTHNGDDAPQNRITSLATSELRDLRFLLVVLLKILALCDVTSYRL